MGLFSKIGKVLKKTIRGIGKVIKKVTKPFRKVLRKVLKPVGRIVNKLGFVGTLALSWILPGAGTWIGQWLSSFGPGMANLVAKVSTGFTNLMKPFKTVFNSVSEVFKQGVNKIGQMFGFEAPAGMKWRPGGEATFLKDSAGDFILDTTGAKIKMGTTTGKLIADAAVDATTGAVTRAGTEGTVTNWVSKILDPKQKTPSSKADVTTTDIKDAAGETVKKDKNLLGRTLDIVDTKVEDFKTWTDTSTLGRTGKYGLAGYKGYEAFFGDDPQSPWYNSNIGDAQGLLQESSMYAQAPLDGLNFTGALGDQQQTIAGLADRYLTGLGVVAPSDQDSVQFATQFPGYVYNFNEYLQDSLYNIDVMTGQGLPDWYTGSTGSGY